MIEITGTAQHEAWLARTLPPIEQVAPLVWSVPIDCAEFPVRYTFCYLLANEQGDFAVVDPGLNSPLGHEQLLAGIEAAGLSNGRIVAVVVTHLHPDHLGAAFTFAAEHEAPVLMHPRESAFFGVADADAAVDRDRAFLVSNGFPTDLVDAVTITPEFLARTFPDMHETLPLDDGELVPLPGRSIRAVFTPGHTAGHLALVDEDSQLVLTGDHVLPRITSNIGADADEPDRDALAQYYSSLDRIAEYDAFEVCPAHEWRFRGLAERARDLREHHEERDAEVHAVLAEHPDATAYDVARQLTWARGWESLDGSNLRAAVAETRSHLNHAVRGAAR